MAVLESVVAVEEEEEVSEVTVVKVVCVGDDGVIDEDMGAVL